jgi:hypothetical protein
MNEYKTLHEFAEEVEDYLLERVAQSLVSDYSMAINHYDFSIDAYQVFEAAHKFH